MDDSRAPSHEKSGALLRTTHKSISCLRKGYDGRKTKLSLVKWAGTMTKSSVSQEEEFLLLPPPPDESFRRKPAASWVGEAWALARSCWISARDCCSDSEEEERTFKKQRGTKARIDQQPIRHKNQTGISAYTTAHKDTASWDAQTQCKDSEDKPVGKQGGRLRSCYKS